MFPKRFLSLAAALVWVLVSAAGATAAEVDSDGIYCFNPEDFSQEEPLVGICITQLPEPQTGTVMLGTRVLRSGDILTAEQVAQMTFAPMRTEEDADALISYLPIYQGRVEPSATMTISIRGKEDKAPAAEDMSLETYKNLPNEGKLQVVDPEGQALTYTVIRQPRRGTVEIREDGSFVYTPKKNKVGVDSFTYTATDPAGKVSREATVTVRILKPTQAEQYTDTAGLDCQFEAEWLRSTGIFVGEQMGSTLCFQPDKTVSRGQFLAMVMQLLEIDTQEQPVYTELAQDAPLWLKPYLAAAVRSGLAANWLGAEETRTDMDAPITGAEAAVILQNALDLSAAEPTALTDGEAAPTLQETALAVLAENGLQLSAEMPLTRAEAAVLLYQVNRLAATAPGLAALRQ